MIPEKSFVYSKALRNLRTSINVYQSRISNTLEEEQPKLNIVEIMHTTKAKVMEVIDKVSNMVKINMNDVVSGKGRSSDNRNKLRINYRDRVLIRKINEGHDINLMQRNNVQKEYEDRLTILAGLNLERIINQQTKALKEKDKRKQLGKRMVKDLFKKVGDRCIFIKQDSKEKKFIYKETLPCKIVKNNKNSLPAKKDTITVEESQIDRFIKEERRLTRIEIGRAKKKQLKSVIIPKKEQKEIREIKRKNRYKSLKLTNKRKSNGADTKLGERDSIGVDNSIGRKEVSIFHPYKEQSKPKQVKRRSKLNVNDPVTNNIIKSVIFQHDHTIPYHKELEEPISLESKTNILTYTEDNSNTIQQKLDLTSNRNYFLKPFKDKKPCNDENKGEIYDNRYKKDMDKLANINKMLYRINDERKKRILQKAKREKIKHEISLIETQKNHERRMLEIKKQKEMKGMRIKRKRR